MFLDLKYGIKRTTKTFLCLPQPHVKDFHSQSSDFEILKNPLGNVHFNTYYKGLHVLDGYHYALKISKRTYGWFTWVDSMTHSCPCDIYLQKPRILSNSLMLYHTSSMDYFEYNNLLYLALQWWQRKSMEYFGTTSTRDTWCYLSNANKIMHEILFKQPSPLVKSIQFKNFPFKHRPCQVCPKFWPT